MTTPLWFYVAGVVTMATPEFSIGPANILEVTTSRLAAVFHGATLVALTDQTNGHTYGQGLTGTSGPDLCLLNQDGQEMRSAGTGTWTLQRDEARYLEQQESGGFAVRLRSDPVSGDLVLTHTAWSGRLGARATRWHVVGLPLASARLIVPAYGGCEVDETLPIHETSFDYPLFWEFQIAVVQTGTGGFSVWSDDTSGQFKFLRYQRQGTTFCLGFETENPGPFDDKTEARSVVWRVNVHQGGWQQAAQRYRDWMTQAFALSFWEADSPWAGGIRALVKVHGKSQPEPLLPRLAKRLVPEKTLLYLPDWRAQGYDVGYPDYTPAAWVREFVDAARVLGFRVMLHVSLPGISPEHPLYERFRFWHLRNPVNYGLIGWYIDSDRPYRHGFINPGSSDYRAMYLRNMRNLLRQLPVDALHLDVNAPMWNDGGGLAEGHTYGAGVRMLQSELKAALPHVVLGGENINELALNHNRFYQVWKLRCAARPHPIRAFLCAPFAAPVGYLGMPNPDHALGEYLDYQRNYEAWGVLPTIPISDAQQLDEPLTSALVDEARRWQELELTPDFTTSDDPACRFRWRGRNGTTASLERTSTLGARLRIDGSLVWERIRGATQWTTPLVIRGWPAQSGQTHFGLRPQEEYVAGPWPAGHAPVRIAAMDNTLSIRAWRSDALATLVSLEQRETETLLHLAAELATARTGVMAGTEERPLERGAGFGLRAGTMENAADAVLESICPWHGPSGIDTDRWGTTFIEFKVTLPARTDRSLVLETALDESALAGDGCHAIVAINGKEAWRRYKRDPLWETVVLLLPPEQVVRIRLAMDPGPHQDVTFDQLLWRRVRIVAIPQPGPASLTIDSASPVISVAGATVSQYTDDRLNLVAPATGTVVLFTGEPVPITAPVELAELPFTFGTQTASADYIAGRSAYGSGAITQEISGGKAIHALSAHPPNAGQTLFRQSIRLDSAFRRPILRFTADLKEGAQTNGVAFAVHLNGEPAWHWATRSPGSATGEVPLHNWRETPLLIEWITDAAGDAGFDWCRWLAPRIEDGE